MKHEYLVCIAIALVIAGTAYSSQPRDEQGEALFAAAQQGDIDKIKALLAESADVNKSNPAGFTTLHVAAAAGQQEVCALLLEKGAAVDAQGWNNQTPLHWAAMSGHRDVARLFIKNGADVTAKDSRGRTAWDLARGRGHTEMAELLLKGLQATVTTAKGDKFGERAEATDANQLAQLLFAAVQAGDVEQVKTHLANGADAGARDASGRLPLHCAVAGDHQEILFLLIARAVQPGSFEYKELAKVKRLLAQGMDVNAQGPGGNTLLHFAAQTGYAHVAGLLIGMGADVDARNDPGKTPLQVAREHHTTDVALLITEAHTGTFLRIDQDSFVRWLSTQDIAPSGEGDGGHDVSVTHVTVSSQCIQGDTVPIRVMVENRASHRETFGISIADMADHSQLAAISTALGMSCEHNVQDKADLVFDPDTIGNLEFGAWVCIGGDVNGDGFADALICAPRAMSDRGRVYLYHGGVSMDARPDVIFTGENEGHRLGNQSGALADLNNDGYDDVIIGAPGRTWNDTTDGYVNVYYGGPDMDNVADVILKGESGSEEHLGLMVATGDIDNDGYADILAGAQGYDNLRGRVYLFWGGDPFDTAPDVILEGEAANSLFGRRIDAGGDVNGDGYADILVGARAWGDEACGRAYLFPGNTREQMDTVSDCTFTGQGRVADMGSSLDIFDLDNDGMDDVIVGARHAADASGQVYIYWGASNFDGSQPGVVLEGQMNSAMGGDMIECCYFNDDPYGDILVGAWRYPDWIYDHGLAYLYYGGARASTDIDRDHVFAGEGGTMDMFGCQLAVGDMNKDGYTDALISAPYGNHGAGRGYLYYGPFHSVTDITFNWDTTNASIGKHTLKVEITPVPGEQNTEDNVKVVTIEVKEPAG